MAWYGTVQVCMVGEKVGKTNFKKRELRALFFSSTSYTFLMRVNLESIVAFLLDVEHGFT